MTTYCEPAWDKIKDDVNLRLCALQAVWTQLEKDGPPEALQMAARDLIIPALYGIMQFCDAVQIDDDADKGIS
jgi:hypothetical protein